LLWIKARWKVKGRIDLELGSKGFFTTIFSDPSEREKVFEEGPYFFNSVGLHMRYWTERFTPEKENFTEASVWIRLYSLPREFWELETLEGIGNTLGAFVKISEITKASRYVSYARICVYMNVAGALPESIVISYQDEEWTQTLDYEHISFRCRKCHTHGHLFRDFPLNVPPPGNAGKGETDPEGFAKIPRKRKAGRRQPKQQTVNQNKTTSNSFQILAGEPSGTNEKENDKNLKHHQRPPQVPKRRSQKDVRLERTRT
jgi:hypothetical protein